MALTSVGLDSCKGVEWDTQETLVGLSESWTRIYVEDLMHDYSQYKDVAKDSTRKVQYTVTFNDTDQVLNFTLITPVHLWEMLII